MGLINGPNQVALITCRYKDRDNIIAMTWHTRISFQPNLFLIAVGKERFSHDLIKKSKCFCVNFIPHSLTKEIIYCGNKSGRDVDKFTETGLKKEECKTIDCCRIKEALTFFECKIIKEVEAGDHTLFIGEVLKSEFKKKGKRPFQFLDNKFTTTVD